MIEVEIQMCALCHTDIHMRDNDWGTVDYPLVAGHEGIGKVSRVGSAVRQFSVGDRAGLSWMRDSCVDCKNCLSGHENKCEKGYQGLFLGKSSGVWGDSPLHYNEHGGAYARVQRIEERFAVKIPDIIPNEMASPLLCAGATMYEPLREYTQPGQIIGIAGIGALGTLGIKLAKCLGVRVVPISSSSKKRQAMEDLGVHGYLDTSNEEEVKEMEGSLDVVLDTTPVNSGVDLGMGLLKIGGTYVKVGLPPFQKADFHGNFIPFVFSSKKIVGSAVAGTKNLKEMMEVVKDNYEQMKDKDMWKAEVVPFEKINDAMDQVENRTHKGYKFVFTW